MASGHGLEGALEEWEAAQKTDPGFQPLVKAPAWNPPPAPLGRLECYLCAGRMRHDQPVMRSIGGQTVCALCWMSLVAWRPQK
jgi:hypothetical protein